MIVFKKIPAPTAPNEVEENRFDLVRKAAQEEHRKSDAEAPRRRAARKPEDDRLL
ncbi:hypothetical protein [Aquibium sp. ELW1220]|jgi:hypothetical protein|uniref:hypothetical protein n=1 Tax=Aquibium sp. ELW1220 TaxID=2976766 RepID=UPI0025B078A2|nr:hypothetical protein [Aquibium sp. ELW1220]MDN2582210.1 hypothetical protein [Aquibium sp. ELW1220]